MADLSLDLTVTSDTFQDLLVLDGDLVMTNDLESTGTDPVLQDILQTIRWILGEWFLNTQGGLPWFQEILIKNADLAAINAVLLGTIQTVPGVIAVTRFVITKDSASRSFRLVFSVQKSTGVVSYDGLVSF